MLVYILLIGVPILYAMSQAKAATIEKFQMKQRKVLFLFFILYFLLLALRHESIGVDLKSYFHYFSIYGQADWGYIAEIPLDREPAFPVLCKLIYSITSKEQVFVVVLAVLILFPIAYLYIKESENALMSIAIFLSGGSLFVMFFSGIRQSIAIAMTVPLYYCVREKRIIPYFLVIAVAFSFHNSALILLPLYFIYHMRINKNWLLVIIPALILSYVFNKQLFNLSLRFLGERYVERYGEITATGAYTMLLLYVVFVMYAFLIPDHRMMDSDTIGLRNVLIFSVVLQSFAPLNSVAMRLNYYYILFHPLILPKIANRATEQNRQIVIASRVAICLFFFAYFIYNGYTGGDTLHVFPYVPFWGEPA